MTPDASDALAVALCHAHTRRGAAWLASAQSADLPGWLFLTGSQENTETILKKFGSYSKNVEEHLTLLLVGNVPVKRWTKLRPDAPAQLIAERIITVATNGQTKPE